MERMMIAPHSVDSSTDISHSDQPFYFPLFVKLGDE
jgi:hypothetical protein